MLRHSRNAAYVHHASNGQYEIFELQGRPVNKGPRRKTNGLLVKVNFFHGSHKNGTASAELAEWIDDVEWRNRRSTDFSQHRVEQHCVLICQKRHACSSGVTQACGQRSRTVSTRESTTQNDDWKRIGFGWDERRILVGTALFFYESHFFQAAQMTLGLAELSGQESLDEIPGHGGAPRAGPRDKGGDMIVPPPPPRRAVGVGYSSATGARPSGTHAHGH